jgi:hypothetical protein
VKTLQEIKQVIAANRAAGNYLFENLESAEIGDYSRWLMFGDSVDEEDFDRHSWSLIVD